MRPKFLWSIGYIKKFNFFKSAKIKRKYSNIYLLISQTYVFEKIIHICWLTTMVEPPLLKRFALSISRFNFSNQRQMSFEEVREQFMVQGKDKNFNWTHQTLTLLIKTVSINFKCLQTLAQKCIQIVQGKEEENCA